MFSWDGLQQRFILVDERPFAVSDVGMICVDDAPSSMHASDLIAPGDDLDLVTGWLAVIPLGESPMVLMLDVEGFEAEKGEVRIGYGPDPYKVPGGHDASIINDRIVHLATESRGDFWTMIQLMNDAWSVEVRNRKDLLAAMDFVSSLPFDPVSLTPRNQRTDRLLQRVLGSKNPQ